MVESRKTDSFEVRGWSKNYPRSIEKTAALLRRWIAEKGERPLSDYFTGYLLQGEDNQGNVLFTGYFTPVMKVAENPTGKYRHPIYRKPNSAKAKLSRREIDTERGLSGDDLEIAWSSSLLDNFFLQVQGSGMVVYPDGKKNFLRYAGKNGRPYRSIGRFLVESGEIESSRISLGAIREWFGQNPDRLHAVLNLNPSYVYFEESRRPPAGAAGLELTDKYSVASDTRFVPFGTALLAQAPELDSEGNLKSHRLRLLFPQDRGSAIKGPGHLDIYYGLGERAQKMAGSLHHYGNVWLLLAK